MTGTSTNPPLLGYVDRLSARPGDTLEFKVSSASSQPFSARLTRSISADPNPAGQGIVELDASEYFLQASFPSTEQSFHAGSYGVARNAISATAGDTVTLTAIIFPTLRRDSLQTILSIGTLDLHLDARGAAAISDGKATLSTRQPLELRQWYRIEATIGQEMTTIRQTPLGRSFELEATATAEVASKPEITGIAVIAASIIDGLAKQHFNGKIESPGIIIDGKPIAVWDFSAGIPSTTAKALAGPDIDLVNFPARAMTSSNWDGSEMNWRHKPAHYAAIHFHEDDIYDFEWKTDFTFTVPEGMPSGAYVMRLDCDGHSDAIPFFVCAALGKPTAKLCVLVSTFTYTIYGNHARPDYDPSWQDRVDAWNAYPYNPANYRQYGMSTYNNHSDGTGICHASHRRPLFNLRPGFLTFGATPCSGLRHFPADSHLISWLHAKGIDYDLVTDFDLHRDGVDAIKGYAAVTTGSHPEYHTDQTLNALRDYRDNGGNLMYLGGNGFYWRIAVHEENDGMLEIRRAEDGIRAWAAEPGEYYNAFDGSYGGLWRRNGRPPQSLVGVGFTAQGEFFGAPYQRVCTDPAFNWVFDGVTDDLVGDFGFSGNGASGFELDHMDKHLGTPGNAVLLARSVTRDGQFMLVPEEMLTHLTNLSGGPAEDIMHADMIHFTVPGGGSVFSTGSITFCGSLPWNNFDNNVSRLLENVMSRSLAGTGATIPGRATQSDRADPGIRLD